MTLLPTIVERRTVDAAPRAAIPCQGSDQNGTPPNRSGGSDPSIRGERPADVLLEYLDRNATAMPAGYVEMVDPAGTITYGVDASNDGWTTLLFVERDEHGWYLGGWTASGC